MSNQQTQFLLGYIRKSIIDEVEGAPSPARQKSTIRQWAERHGFQVKMYEDMDISGRYEANRVLFAYFSTRGCSRRPCPERKFCKIQLN